MEAGTMTQLKFIRLSEARAAWTRLNQAKVATSPPYRGDSYRSKRYWWMIDVYELQPHAIVKLVGLVQAIEAQIATCYGQINLARSKQEEAETRLAVLLTVAGIAPSDEPLLPNT
jgi:hypothetical protein